MFQSKTDFQIQLNALDTHGLLPSYEKSLTRLKTFLPTFCSKLPGFAEHVLQNDDIGQINELGACINSQFKHVIIVGTGGSSLGAQAATDISRYNIASRPQLYFPDSLDAREMNRLCSVLPAEETHVVAISKSGTTAETLAQVLAFHAWIKKTVPGEKISDHFSFVTEPGERPLRRFAEKLGSTVLEHPTTVGGRFSVLTAVGMLPAAIAGQQVGDFRCGAKTVLQTLQESPEQTDALKGAALAFTLAENDLMSEVCLMPYAESLRSFTRWFAQLWAESLGKDGQGSTPLAAVGPVDQHSQLQLYLDGPNNKIFTIVTIPNLDQGPRISGDQAKEYGLDYMAGKTIGDMVDCQGRATIETLRGKGRMVRHLTLSELDEETLGAMFMSFMLETVFMAHLMGIDAYDQPAVEGGKILTRQYLSELSE